MSSQDQSTFWSEGRPASPSVLPDSERVWMTLVAISPLSFFDLLKLLALDGFSGRTYQACLRSIEGGRLEPFSEGWKNSGTWGPSESWTAATTESLSDEDVSLLSDILEEDSSLPSRCYLTAHNCSRLAARSEKYNRPLPTDIREALKKTARMSTD